MLRLCITRLVQAKSLKSDAVYLRERGFSAKEVRTLSNVVEMQLLKDTSVQRLCEALVCTPNDLFCWDGKLESHLKVLNTARVSNLDVVFAELSQREVELLVLKARELAVSLENPVSTGEGRLWLNVRHLIAQRQEPQPYSFLISKEFTPAEAGKLLNPNRKAIRLTVLSRLCEAFHCLPNDLFDWEGSENHHLNALRKIPVVDLKALLSQLPPDEVRKILMALQEKGGGE